MRSSIFQYPYGKIFRRAEFALSRMGMRIVSSDAEHGNIKAVTGFSLKKPSMKVELTIEEMENQNTRVTITGVTNKNFFFQKRRDVETGESEILETLSSIL